MNAKLSIEKIEFNPLLLDFSIKNLELVKNKQKLVSIGNLTTRVSLIKSIVDQEISIKRVVLTKIDLNIIKNKENIINFTKLLKENNSKNKNLEDKKSTKFPKIRVQLFLIDDFNVLYKEIKDSKNFEFSLTNLKYRINDLNTYDYFSSYSLNTLINKNAKLNIQGGLKLFPFNMYGKLSLNKLEINKILDYKSEIYNFQTSSSLLDLNFGFNTYVENEFKLNINDANVELQNFYLLQNSKKVLGFKRFKINSLNYDLGKNDINIKEIKINEFITNIRKKENLLNINTLIKKDRMKNEKNVKNGTIVKNEELKNKKNTLKLKINNININESNISFKDKISSIKVNKINSDINFISYINNIISVENFTYVNESINSSDKNSETKIENFILKINNIKYDNKNASVDTIKIKNDLLFLSDKSKNFSMKKMNLDINKILYQDNYLSIKNSVLNKPLIEIMMKKNSIEKNKKSNKKVVKKQNEAFVLNIGPVKINNAKLVFIDKNLPIDFKSTISNLNGSFSQFHTNSSKQSKLSLIGDVNEYAYVKINGFLNPNDIQNLTDVTILFKNLSIKDFSAYSSKFIGRKIKEGKLNLDLKYNIKESSLNAKNIIIVNNIILGEEIKSKDAISLPLAFGIVLLEDKDGIIKLDIPLTGNLNDPKFEIAPLIWKVLKNIISKAVSSPFRFLASAFGFDENEINNVEFHFAKNEILSSEKETLNKLAKILKEKPKLELIINKTYHEILDKKYIKEEKFNKLLNQTMKNEKKSKDIYLSALEKLYEELENTDLEALLNSSMDKKGLNKTLYKNNLEYKIRESIKVNNIELELLATQRAQNISLYLLDKKIKRIKIKNGYIIQKDKKSSFVKIKLNLTID